MELPERSASSSKLIPLEPLFPTDRERSLTSAHPPRLSLPSEGDGEKGTASPGAKMKSPSNRFDDPMLSWKEAAPRPDVSGDLTPSSPSSRSAARNESPRAHGADTKSPWAKLKFGRKSPGEGSPKASALDGLGGASDLLGDLVTRRHSCTTTMQAGPRLVGGISRMQQPGTGPATQAAGEDDNEFTRRLSVNRSLWRAGGGPGAMSPSGEGLQSQTHDALRKLLGDSNSMKRRESLSGPAGVTGRSASMSVGSKGMFGQLSPSQQQQLVALRKGFSSGGDEQQQQQQQQQQLPQMGSSPTGVAAGRRGSGSLSNGMPANSGNLSKFYQDHQRQVSQSVDLEQDFMSMGMDSNSNDSDGYSSR